MDLQIIAYWLFELGTYAWVIDPQAWIVILKVAFGLGMVIFVHELGHFGVAKLCGVQCDKFYLGFDIGGWKLCKFKWGETEYGIGILPLGGYVKMLGQEDNPARLKEELQRAKAAQTAQAASSSGGKPPADADPDGKAQEAEKIQTAGGETIDIAAAEQALYNPRSYLAQSVPRRMAIISAGVIMNLVFAFICAVIAFYMGVRQTACVVGQVQPGSPAWQAGLECDDRIVSVAGKRAYSFVHDLMSGVTLGDNEEGVEIVVQRPGESEEKTIVVRPTLVNGLFPTIGILSSYTTTLSDQLDAGRPPTIPGSAADLAQPALRAGDKIIKIDGEEIETYGDVRRCLFRKANRTVVVTVERTDGIEPADVQFQESAGERKSTGAKSPQSQEQGGAGKSELVDVELPAQPMRRFGLQMAMGPILAVQSGSPAAAAGIEPGDVITKIDGRPMGDPMTLSARLRNLQAKEIPLVVERNGQKIRLNVTPRAIDTDIEPIWPDGALGVPHLGIAYNVITAVAAVDEGSSTQQQGVKPGDVIVEANVILPDEETLESLGYADVFDKAAVAEPVEFSEEMPNWPYFIYRIVQMLPPQSRVRFQLSDGRNVELQLHESRDWFNTDRGFLLEPLTILRQAESLADAVSLGAVETWSSATKVFVFIEKLSGGQISPRALGGPVTIAKVAGHEASKGTAELLLFLTLLSANLAVINFLPIPVLDGGHMVFLAWEGIRGKPADERLQLLLSYMGLIFILGLMLFVLGLDFEFISRK